MIETFDVQTYSSAGPYVLNLEAIRQKADQPVPGRPDMCWGVEAIYLEANFTAAALSSMAAPIQGARVQEFLDRCEIVVKGWDRPACYASGRSMTELRRVQEGAYTQPTPTAIADADATVTPRYVFEYVFRDPRLAEPDQAIPHAVALGHGKIALTFSTAAITTGLTFTSVVLTAKVRYRAIPKGHIPIPMSLYEEALGNGVVSATRNPLPNPDAAVNMWLFLKGSRTTCTATQQRCEFDETVTITVDAGGKRIIDDQSIQSLTERLGPQLYDMASAEALAAPVVLHLLFPPQQGILLSEVPQTSRAGLIRSSASMDDSGNTSTALQVVSYGAYGVPPESAADAAYVSAIAQAHFPGVKVFEGRPLAASGKAVIPSRVAHLVPRIVTPLRSK